MTRRGRAIAVCCALALAVLWWWWRASAAPDVAGDVRAALPAAAPAAGDADRASANDPPAAPRTARPGDPMRTPTAATATTAGEETPTLGPDDLARQPQVAALAARAADEYRQRAQYPPWSQPFDAEGTDPILRDREVSPVTAAGPDGEEPILVVFPAQVSFEAPDPVLLYAYLTRGNDRVPAQAIVGTLTTETLQPLGDFAYHDDGRDGDARAGDAIYSARLQLDDEMLPQLSDSFMVRVRALIDEGERVAATGFLYSNPHAQLTGNYRDAIVDGSLVIEAEIEVARGGRFHLEGTLYDRSGGTGLAEAHTAAELAPGRHWLALPFFGRILHQRGVDGPYLLRYLALSTTTRMPNGKNRLVENAHVTGAYRAGQFSDAPFADADLLDAADRLERSLEE